MCIYDNTKRDSLLFFDSNLIRLLFFNVCCIFNSRVQFDVKPSGYQEIYPLLHMSIVKVTMNGVLLWCYNSQKKKRL